MPYNYDILEEDNFNPSDSSSPLEAVDPEEDSYESLSAKSPLSKLMVSRARELSPRRQDIVDRRDALLSAYKSLIAAQQNRPLPVDNPGTWMAGAAGLMESQDPNMRAFGAGQIARYKAMTDQSNKEAEALRNQAIAGMQMNAADLDFLDKDQAKEMDLLKGAASSDYHQKILQMRMMLEAMRNPSFGAKNNTSITPEVVAAAGVPLYSGSDPYAGLDNVGKRQLRMQFEKQIQKMQEEAEPMQGAIERMKRFEQLNELKKNDLTGPGPISDILPNWSDEMKEMESIAAEITPQMRTPGSGSTSDFDARMFQKATIGTGKRYETNKNIAAAYIANRQNEIDKSQFMESYLNTNGHARGAQQAWKKYLNDNPIFDKNSKSFELNSSRRTWQEYFGGKNSETDSKADLSEESSPELPPAPQGYDPEKWKKIYSKMTPEQKKLFGGN